MGAETDQASINSCLVLINSVQAELQLCQCCKGMNGKQQREAIAQATRRISSAPTPAHSKIGVSTAIKGLNP